MLDGDGVVVADHAQRAHHVLPNLVVVTVAHGAEDPGAVDFVAVVLGVQHAVGLGVDLVDLGVLGVEEVDGLAQVADGVDRVNALPEQMRGIEVRADEGAYGLAQTKQRFGVVDAEARVHFQRDFLHPVRGGKGGRTPPVGNEHLLPLVFQNFLIIIRPGTGNPVGRAILRAAAGTAAEAHNALYAQPFGQQHRVLKILPKGFGHVRVGMDGVAVRAERRQFQTVFLQYALECG